MELKIGIEKAEAEIVKQKLISFYGTNYWGADDKFFEWMYFKNPWKKYLIADDKYCAIVIKINNEISAIDTFYPIEIIYKKNKIVGIWEIELNNFSSIPLLGLNLINCLHKISKFHLAYGFNSLSKIIYKRTNCKLYNNIERMISIIDYKILTKLLNLSPDSYKYEFYKSYQIDKKNIRQKYFLIKSIDNILNLYYLSHIERCAFTINKDLAYIKWRYFENPNIDYEIISADKNTITGIAVIRKENIRNTKFYALRILDFFPTFNNEDKLLKAIINYAFDNKIILIDFFCTSKKFCNTYFSEFFVGYNIHKKINVPRLFQPLEIRKRQSINFVFWNSLNIKNNNLYATKADGDQDVNVNYEYKTVQF